MAHPVLGSGYEGEPLGEDKFVAAMIRKFRARVVDPPSSSSPSSSPRSLSGVLEADGECRDCGGPVKWVTTARGKKMPVDVIPAKEGTEGFELIGVVDPTAHFVKSAAAWEFDGSLYEFHGRTCPERDDEPEPVPEKARPFRAKASPFCTLHSSHFCPCVWPSAYTPSQRAAYLKGEWDDPRGKKKRKVPALEAVAGSRADRG